jgi:hypothetical protein
LIRRCGDMTAHALVPRGRILSDWQVVRSQLSIQRCALSSISAPPRTEEWVCCALSSTGASPGTVLVGTRIGVVTAVADRYPPSKSGLCRCASQRRPWASRSDPVVVGRILIRRGGNVEPRALVVWRVGLERRTGGSIAALDTALRAVLDQRLTTNGGVGALCGVLDRRVSTNGVGGNSLGCARRSGASRCALQSWHCAVALAVGGRIFIRRRTGDRARGGA